MTDHSFMDDYTIPLYGFGVLFFGMAIWVLVLFIRAFKEIKDSKSWPRAC
jgi:hypothetical protein